MWRTQPYPILIRHAVRNELRNAASGTNHACIVYTFVSAVGVFAQGLLVLTVLYSASFICSVRFEFQSLASMTDVPEAWVLRAQMFVMRKRMEVSLLQTYIDVMTKKLVPARLTNLAEAQSEHESDFFSRTVSKIEKQAERLRQIQREITLVCDGIDEAVAASDRIQCAIFMEPCNAECATVEYMFFLDEP